MFSITPGSVTRINISVADCTVSHTYLEHDGSLNIFIEPKLEPIYPGPDRVMNPLLTLSQPLLTPSTSSAYTPSHPPLSNLNSQTDMTQQNYSNNEQNQDNQQDQDTDNIGGQSQEPLFSSESGIEPISPHPQDYQDAQDQEAMSTPQLSQDMPPAIPGKSSFQLSHASHQDPPSTFDARKILFLLKSQGVDIPFEGTPDQLSFFSQHQQLQEVFNYKPAPKSEQKQPPQPDKDHAPTSPYSDSDSDSDCHIEEIEYAPQRAPQSSTSKKATSQLHLLPGGKPAVVVQRIPIKAGHRDYNITVKQVLDRKRPVTDQSSTTSNHSSMTTEDKKKKHKHTKRDKDRDAK